MCYCWPGQGNESWRSPFSLSIFLLTRPFHLRFLWHWAGYRKRKRRKVSRWTVMDPQTHSWMTAKRWPMASLWVDRSLSALKYTGHSFHEPHSVETKSWPVWVRTASRHIILLTDSRLIIQRLINLGTYKSRESKRIMRLGQDYISY